VVNDEEEFGMKYSLQLIIVCFIAFSISVSWAEKPADDTGCIMTVLGAINPDELGKVLPHEHAAVDFEAVEGKPYGDKLGDIEKVMTARLKELAARGYGGFVDCTPEYLGRDVELLHRISKQTGLHILTNTGYYGAMQDKFVPKHIQALTAEQISGRWVAEWEKGIGHSGVRPGFIKIGVDQGKLSDLDRKLVIAAALAHKQTGLTIACHTGEELAAVDVLETVIAQNVDPSSLIIVHAQGVGDPKTREKIARAGAWLEFEGISPGNCDKTLEMVKQMRDAGLLGRVLLSHDRGYYDPAQESGGLKEGENPMLAIEDHFVPALREAGFDDAQIEALLVKNPARAFTIGIRIPNIAPKSSISSPPLQGGVAEGRGGSNRCL